MTSIGIYAKRAAAAAVLIILSLMLSPITAFADNSVLISAPTSDVDRGSEFNVSVAFTADSRIGTVQAALSYSEQDIEFVSSDFAYGGGGIVNLAAFPQRSTTTMTVTLTFRALRQGSSSIHLTNGSIMSPDGAMLAGSLSASAEVTVGAALAGTDSDDDNTGSYTESLPDELKATLATLTVSAGELKPAFSPGIYDYTVTVPNEVEYFGIDAEPAGLYDTIWFEGSEYLGVGQTLRTITVTSGDSTVSNVYTVTITRLPADDDSEDDSDADSDTDTDEIFSDGEELSEDTSASNGDPEAAISSSNTMSPRTRDSSSGEEKTGMQELRDKLMPAMIVAMAAIVLGVAILVVYIRKKSHNILK